MSAILIIGGWKCDLFRWWLAKHFNSFVAQKVGQKNSAMDFPVRIQGTGTVNNLFSQWCLVGTGNRNRKHLCTWWPREDADLFLRCRSTSENVFPGILDKFSGVSLTSKTCFQTQTCCRFDKFMFWESNIWRIYVSCMSWCVWCVRGGPTGRSLWR